MKHITNQPNVYVPFLLGGVAIPRMYATALDSVFPLVAQQYGIHKELRKRRHTQFFVPHKQRQALQHIAEELLTENNLFGAIEAYKILVWNWQQTPHVQGTIPYQTLGEKIGFEIALQELRFDALQTAHFLRRMRKEQQQLQESEKEWRHLRSLDTARAYISCCNTMGVPEQAHWVADELGEYNLGHLLSEVHDPFGVRTRYNQHERHIR